jgi:hypothetical protein
MPSALGNKFVKMVVNSPLHPLVGRNFAVITVTGCKTGRSIETPVNVARIGQSLIIISFRKRSWWKNLRDGRISRLRLSGKKYSVRSEVVETPAGVANGLKEYFSQYPRYAKHFKLDLGADQSPEPQQLNLLAKERVIIKLFRT